MCNCIYWFCLICSIKHNYFYIVFLLVTSGYKFFDFFVTVFLLDFICSCCFIYFIIIYIFVTACNRCYYSVWSIFFNFSYKIFKFMCKGFFSEKSVNYFSKFCNQISVFAILTPACFCGCKIGYNGALNFVTACRYYVSSLFVFVKP